MNTLQLIFGKFIIIASILIASCSFLLATPTGEDLSDTTDLKGTATISTATVVSYTEIDVNYYVNNRNIDENGVVYSTTNNMPTLGDSHMTQGTAGTGTYNLTISGLTEGKTYYFRSYYTYSGTTTYSTEAISESTYNQAEEPSSSVTNFVGTLDINSIEFIWTATGGASFYLIQHQEGTTAPTVAPDLPFGGNHRTLYGNYGTIVNNPGKTISGLTANTTYTFLIAPGNPTLAIIPPYTNNSNLRQTNPATLTLTTLAVAPTTQASSVSFSDQTASTLTIEWANGNGDGRSVYINTENTFTAPTGNYTPTANVTWQGAGQQCIYNGTGTSVTVTEIDQVHNYYVRVYEYSTNSAGNPNYYTVTATNNPNSVTATYAQWNGSNNSWSTATNWLLGTTPSTIQGIIIPDTQGSITAPTISSTESVTSVIIEQGGELTIDTDGSLSVSGDFIIEGDANGSGSLLVEGSGSLSVTGSSIFNRYIPGGGAYHYVSNPTSGTDIMQFYGFYADDWDESTPEWVALDGLSSISVMNGYSIKYNSQSQTIDFTGTFNNGSQSTTVTNSNTSDNAWGWNLVGNPYPSAIDWDAASGWTRSDINATAYFWNGSGYDDYNYTSNSGSATSSIIPAGQGFFIFVENTTSSTTLGVNNNVRVNSASTDFYKNKSQTPQIAIKLENEFLSDQTHIAFYPGATDAYDHIIDGYKLFGSKTNFPQIYTITPDNNKLSINTITDELLKEKEVLHETNVGYISKINTTLTLSLSKIIDIPDSLNVFLIDKYLNDTIDIEVTSYSFETQIGEFEDRFSIIFKKTTSNETGIASNATNVYAYVKNSELHVILNEPLNSGEIVVYDILGAPIINKSLTTKTHYILPISQKTNTFVVNVLTDKSILLRKTLINKY